MVSTVFITIELETEDIGDEVNCFPHMNDKKVLYVNTVKNEIVSK